MTVELDGLSIGALHELFRTRLDVSFPRPTLVRLSETSGGNPLFALELADALRRRGSALAPGEALPIPSTVDELLGERLRGLGTSAIEVARVVAAVGEATVDVVEGVLGDRCEAALAEALDAKILERDGAHLRFTHPLLGSAVAARQTSAHRRSLHTRLATVVPTAEERARHLALATTEPDGEIAATLEDAARSAQARGAPATAAELAEHAFRLTPELTSAARDDVSSSPPQVIMSRATPTARSSCSRAREQRPRRVSSAPRSSSSLPPCRRIPTMRKRCTTRRSPSRRATTPWRQRRTSGSPP